MSPSLQPALRSSATPSPRGKAPKTPITAQEKPFEIPEGWKWVRLEDICSYIVDCPHTTPLKSNEKTQYPCIRTSEIQNGEINWNSMQYIDYEEYKKELLA